MNHPKVEDKNPITKTKYGVTVLHFAAINGHLDVCQLIIKNVENKNPVDNSRRTPKKIAQHKKFDEIVQLFQILNL